MEAGLGLTMQAIEAGLGPENEAKSISFVISHAHHSKDSVTTTAVSQEPACLEVCPLQVEMKMICLQLWQLWDQYLQ